MAPAGGWVVLVSSIRPTASPTANPIDQGVIFIKVATDRPIAVVNRCPTMTFRGCAKGLSGRPNRITMVAPKGAINQREDSVMALRLPSVVIHSMAPKPAIKGARWRDLGRRWSMGKPLRETDRSAQSRQVCLPVSSCAHPM
ncbi:hypothetical protein HPA02_31820 [Bisbaumannia pacifica]|uniref:Uncharacterized protein n=1 Tax=Bisbaumannia pacifica TaxID=77098 RepID=A0A510XBS5_9GAMM|nr:hypothetical protein HPA02_31820 [Halomonas pacifica]